MSAGLIVLGAGTAVVLYVAAVFCFAAWLQDRLDRFDIAIPWIVAMLGIFVIPAAIAVGLSQ